MAAPTLQTPYDALPAKFAHKDADVEFRLQCFVLVRDEKERIGLVRVEGIDGWCIPAESMKVNESPDQAAVRVVRTWFETPMQLWLERVVSFPATGPHDNRWYMLFLYGAEAPQDLKGTPDTQEIAFFPLDADPAPFAMSHREVWDALR